MNFHNFNNEDELSKFGFPSRRPMAGVPGCGKSLGARVLEHRSKVKLSVNASDLRGRYVGESEEKIARLLDLAESYGPSMDAILEIVDTPGEPKKQYRILHAENIQNAFRKRLQNDVTKETRRKSWKQTIIRNIHHVTQLVFELIQYLREKGYG